jgi:hypothetical protein
MPFDIDTYIDATASALDLTIDPAWRPVIKANVEFTMVMARLVDDFKLPDVSEPAPIYVA